MLNHTTSDATVTYGTMLVTGCDHCGADMTQPLTAATHDLHICDACHAGACVECDAPLTRDSRGQLNPCHVCGSC